MEYIASADQQILNTRYRTAVVIALAFASSIIVFLIIGQLIKVEPKPVEMMDWRRILYSTAVIIGFLAVVLRRMLLSRALMSNTARQGATAVLQRLTMVSIVGGALGEAVGIMGFLGYLMTGDLDYSWRLGAIGLLLVAYSFPRRNEWARNVALVEKSGGEAKLLGQSRV